MISHRPLYFMRLFHCSNPLLLPPDHSFSSPRLFCSPAQARLMPFSPADQEWTRDADWASRALPQGSSKYRGGFSSHVAMLSECTPRCLRSHRLLPGESSWRVGGGEANRQRQAGLRWGGCERLDLVTSQSDPSLSSVSYRNLHILLLATLT